MALDVNERGQAVGWRREFQAGYALEPTAFLYQDGLDAPIPTLYEANGINSAGHIVGSVRVTQGDLESRHAAVLADGTVTDLGTLGGRSSVALAINDAGVVVGWADTPTGSHAFRYANGVMTDLGTLGGANSVANGINASGAIVGAADRADGTRRAFLVTGSGMADLGTLGGASSEARAINDMGQVVGWSETSLSDPYSTRAFVFSDGAMHDLNGYLSAPLLTGASCCRPFYLLTAARGINRSGQVVADANDGSGMSGLDKVVLLTPLGP
jgi:probable HAF family extracellular repeat protein